MTSWLLGCMGQQFCDYSKNRKTKDCYTGVNFINILRERFSYKHHLLAAFYSYMYVEKRRLYEKFVRIMLKKLTTEWCVAHVVVYGRTLITIGLKLNGMEFNNKNCSKIFSPNIRVTKVWFFFVSSVENSRIFWNFYRFVWMLEEKSIGLCLKTFSTFPEQDWVKWQGKK